LLGDFGIAKVLDQTKELANTVMKIYNGSNIFSVSEHLTIWHQSYSSINLIVTLLMFGH